jgi:nodulation protein E
VSRPSAVRRVVVTGLGAVSALACDLPRTWAALLAGRTGIAPFLGARTAAAVQDFDGGGIEPRRLGQLDRAAQLAVVAAREAWRSATVPPGDPARRAAVLGAPPGLDTLDRSYKRLYGEGNPRVHPLTVPRVMPSAGVSAVSAELSLRGPSFAVASACSSSAHAVAQAALLIRVGLADLVVAGGADAPLVPGNLRAWEALRVLSPDLCRPFSSGRPGLVLGEGAGILILEDREAALARGAPILAELAGIGMTGDAGDLTAPDPEGAAAAMQAALVDAEMKPGEIGYVNAHGTGTRLNDRAESTAVHRVFADRPPPMSSVKGALGHTLSAAGGIEAAVTVMALREGVLPPTAGFERPDPECPVDPVPEARRVRIAAALTNSFAFGGLNCSLLFRTAA